VKVGPMGGVDLTNWEAVMIGPEGSSYEGETLCLDICFPPNYPKNPPKIVFKSKIDHPYISAETG